MKKLTLTMLSAACALATGCVAVPYESGPVYDNAPVYRDNDHHHGRHDRDRDRDGIPDKYDRDRDGDGQPNRYDRRPNNPNRY